jgi:hypothetical protein
MNTNVSILAEIPEDLHLSMQGYLDGNPDWDQDRVFSAAISLFLLQNTVENTPEASLNYRRAARVYLETLFRDQPEISPTSLDESACLEESVSSTIGLENLSGDVLPVSSPMQPSKPPAAMETTTSEVNEATMNLDPQHHIDAA